MKIKIEELRDLVRQVVQEAAKEGAIQRVYRNSYKRMIQKASSGGNKNTPPFTKRSGKVGKSGPPGE